MDSISVLLFVMNCAERVEKGEQKTKDLSGKKEWRVVIEPAGKPGKFAITRLTELGDWSLQQALLRQQSKQNFSSQNMTQLQVCTIGKAKPSRAIAQQLT